jgi:hypothetical protein
MMRGTMRMMAASVLGFLIAGFGFARIAKGERSCANHQGAGQDEGEESFHATEVGGGREKSQASSEIR